MQQAIQETAMQIEQSSQHPIQRSFGAGINQPKVNLNERRDRTVKHRDREVERDG